MEDTHVLALVNGVLNALLSLAATLANSFILVAILKTPSLHSATNTLLFGLALSDLGVGLISQPLGVVLVSTAEFKGREVFFAMFQVFALSLSAVSLLTVTAIGVDRYLALRLHMRYKEFVTFKRAVCLLVVIWASCSFAASYCRWLGDIFLFYSHAASPFIIICLMINIFVYQKLYRVCRFHHAKIRDQAVFLDANLYQRAINEARFRKSVKTIFFILLALILCYFPLCCYTVAIIVIGHAASAMVHTLYLFTWTLVFANSTVNPTLLYFQLTELRVAIKRILKTACGCRQERRDLGEIRSNIGNLEGQRQIDVIQMLQ